MNSGVQTRSRSASIASNSSSPSINTPRPQRSRSSSISSLSAHGDTGAPASHLSFEDDLSDDPDHISPAKKGKGRNKRNAAALEDEVFDPKMLSTAQCQWGDCREEFWELEPMMEHLHSGQLVWSSLRRFSCPDHHPYEQHTPSLSTRTTWAPRRLSSTLAIGLAALAEARIRRPSSPYCRISGVILERSHSTAQGQVSRSSALRQSRAEVADLAFPSIYAGSSPLFTIFSTIHSSTVSLDLYLHPL